MIRVDVLRTGDVVGLDEVRALMDLAFAGDFDDDDWGHTIGGWHAVVTDSGVVVAHAAVVDRTLHSAGRAWRTGYVEGVATHPERQGEGLGTLAMQEIGTIIRRDHELGALGTGEWHFYEQLGWERWHGTTSVRTSSGVERTPEDDDGVMVLRFGPSAGLDRGGDIACEPRPGDVW